MTPIENRAAALDYAGRGWPVLPLHWWADGCCSCGDPACRTPAKHPFSSLVPRGVHDASAVVDVVTSWWRREPRCNVGVRTGPESQLLLLDIDVRDDKDGEASLRSLVATLGPLPATVEAITGSGSRHLLFAWPGHDVPGTFGREFPGVDVKGRGGYFVAAPSTHASGRAYTWEASGHPDDVAVAPLPPAWSARLTVARPEVSAAPPTPARTLDGYTVQKVRGALGMLSPGEYDEWIGAGMALHHETGGSDHGFSLWWEWSATWADENPRSKKVDLGAVRSHWKSFRREDGPRRTFGWLFTTAAARGWVPPDPPVVFAAATPAPTPDAFDDALAHRAPGVLGEIVRWYLSTAACPVPMLGLVAALAVGACAAGRRFTLHGAPGHLYLLVGADSGAGKGHIGRIVRRIVGPICYGPGDFASDSAILSTLRDRPRLVCVLDEFGDQLRASKAMNGSHRAMARSLMKKAWSDEVLTPKALSTLSAKPGEGPAPVEIHAPSLTLVGLATPESLRSALDDGDVEDGFLNRWIILEYDDRFLVPQAQPMGAVPDAIAAWFAAVSAGVDMAPVAPVLTELPTTPEAVDALRQVSIDQTAERNRLRDDRRTHESKLWVRAAENVSRLALIAALADAASPREAVVDAPHVAWARALVWWSVAGAVRRTAGSLGSGDEVRARSAALRAIHAAGTDGILKRELMRGPLRSFPNLVVRNVCDWLEASGAVTAVPLPRNSVRYYDGAEAG